MGYAVVMGACVICKRVFSFNPHKVPSIPDDAGVKQPICKACHAWAQRERAKANLPAWPEPLPGAYDGFPEEEL